MTETGIYRSDWSPPRHNYVGEFSEIVTKKSSSKSLLKLFIFNFHFFQNSEVTAIGHVSKNAMFYGRLDLLEPKSTFGYRSLYLTKISEGDQLHKLGYV